MPAALLGKSPGIPVAAIRIADFFEMLFASLTCSRLAKHESVGVMLLSGFVFHELLSQGFDLLPKLLFSAPCFRLVFLEAPFSLT